MGDAKAIKISGTARVVLCYHLSVLSFVSPSLLFYGLGDRIRAFGKRKREDGREGV